VLPHIWRSAFGTHLIAGRDIAVKRCKVPAVRLPRVAHDPMKRLPLINLPLDQ